MISYKDDLRHAERRLVFNIDELSRLAREAVNRGPDEMVHLEKLAQLRCAVAAFRHDFGLPNTNSLRLKIGRLSCPSERAINVAG